MLQPIETSPLSIDDRQYPSLDAIDETLNYGTDADCRLMLDAIRDAMQDCNMKHIDTSELESLRDEVESLKADIETLEDDKDRIDAELVAEINLTADMLELLHEVKNWCRNEEQLETVCGMIDRAEAER